jgi:phosphoesterase RecJ-like protein
MNSPSLFEQLKNKVKSTRRILLSGPKDPDGDSIGACLALRSLLKQEGCPVVDIAGTLSFRYRWLPDADVFIEDASVKPHYDMVIVLDGDKFRVSTQVKSCFEQAEVKGIIDHHRSTSPEGYDIAIIEPNSPSTCSIIFDLAESWKSVLNKDIATNLYVGLIFDTGGFRYQNTDGDTLKMAAVLLGYNVDHPTINARILAEKRPQGIQLLGHVLNTVQFYNKGSIAVGHVRLEDFERFDCIDEDIEGMVEQLLYITGVELSCLCIERSTTFVKVSLRSRSKVDVSVLAKQISVNGGGHVRAAGAPVNQPFHQAWPRVQKVILGAFEP